MTKPEFIKELLRVAIAIQASDESLNSLDNPAYTDLMYKSFELTSLTMWVKTCDQVSQSWRSNKFPALAVFIEACRSVKADQNRLYSYSNDKCDKKAIGQDMSLILFMMGIQGEINEIVRKQYIKKYGLHKDFKFKGGKKTKLMMQFYVDRKKKGLVFDIKKSSWVSMGQKTINAHFGTLQRDFWIPEHRYKL